MVQGNDWNAVVFEVFQDLSFESAKFFSNAFMLVAAPVLVEAVLPLVPIKNLGNGIHKPGIFEFGR